MSEVQLPNCGPLAAFIWREERLRRRCEILEGLSTHPSFRLNVNLDGISRKDYFAFKVQQARELIHIWFQRKWSREHFLEAGRMVGDLPCYGQFRSKFSH